MSTIVLSRIGMATLMITAVVTMASASKPIVGRLVTPKSTESLACVARPAFLTESRAEIVGGLESIPKSVLVARDAEVWVEGQENGQSIQVHAYQSFLRPKKNAEGKVLCGKAPEGFRERFSMVAPTLIDFTKEHRIGHSFWQFQLVADDQKYSMWNHKSAGSHQLNSMELFLKKEKAPYRLYQVGHNEYEMVMQKESGGVVHTLSIRYEALR